MNRNLKTYYSALMAACLFFPLLSGNVYADDLGSQLAFQKGETITYDIRKLKLKVGEATLVFNGLVEVGNQEALSITFTARGFKFIDEERIYLDSKTFYPLVIKRNLNIFGKEETIVEFYDAQKGKVRIVKTAQGKTSEQTIERGKRFDNIYAFIYRYRQSGQFKKDEEFLLHLPTRDVRFELVEKEKLQVGSREFEAHYMHSTPKKYKVWFDSSLKRIPLKIDGALGAVKASMVMKDYNDGR